MIRNKGYLKYTTIGVVFGEWFFLEAKMEEEWRKIIGFSIYSISNYGSVRNDKTGKILKLAIDRYGYYKINLREKLKNRYATVHRLVAETFIPNHENKPQVNHKDGNKLNNTLDNLEWVTNAENVIHAYENKLNKNANHVKLINIENDTTLYFISIKSLGKWLNIYPSVLVPMIKYSDINPIYGKFVIEILDESTLQTVSNTLNFGKKVFVLDHVTKNITCYSSILNASYHLGIRSLSNLNREKIITKIGYTVSYSKKDLLTFVVGDISHIKSDRINYYKKEYTGRNYKYYLYDYYDKQEYIFDNLNEIVLFFNNQNLSVKYSKIISAINHGVKNKRTSLLLGYGVKSSLCDYEWYPYNEEIILSNKFCCLAPVRVFEVIENNNKEIVFTMENLCKRLSYYPDKILNNVKFEEILKEFSDIPNLSIRRLNSPICN